MAELKTPLRVSTRAGYGLAMIVDAEGVCVCECSLREAEQIVAAVNREAEHAEAVRRLTEQRDKLLAVCKAVATECPVCGSTDLRRDADLGCSTMWCDDCGAGNNHAMLARAAIAAAEGGGT